MSKQHVKNFLVKTFPKCRLHVLNPMFLKCDSTKRLSKVEGLEGFPSGSEILQIASKESIYVVEEPEVVDKPDVVCHV